uniref:Uncharacterized protein n=1 Tax=Rhodosorus marinus TaxID=101924 RepID=A0A7S0G4J4_9RHOD
MAFGHSPGWKVSFSLRGTFRVLGRIILNVVPGSSPNRCDHLRLLQKKHRRATGEALHGLRGQANLSEPGLQLCREPKLDQNVLELRRDGKGKKIFAISQKASTVSELCNFICKPKDLSREGWNLFSEAPSVKRRLPFLLVCGFLVTQ